MGDLRKENSAYCFRGKRFLHGNTWRKKYLSCRILEKNSYTVVCLEKKLYHQGFEKNEILTQTKSPINKSNGQPLS